MGERETETPWKRALNVTFFPVGPGEGGLLQLPPKTGGKRSRSALGEGTVERFLRTGRRRST